MKLRNATESVGWLNTAGPVSVPSEMGVDYTQLDPGVRDVVRLLRRQGFLTTDSGDGKSKPQEWFDAGDAMPFPNVTIRVEREGLFTEADRLRDVLGDSWQVEAVYWPANGSCALLATQPVEAR